jgi:hypothetical protein
MTMTQFLLSNRAPWLMPVITVLERLLSLKLAGLQSKILSQKQKKCPVLWWGQASKQTIIAIQSSRMGEHTLWEHKKSNN